MLIFLAGLKGIPQILYEAAEIDGANRFQRFRRITLPMLSPTIFFNLVMSVIGSFQTFDSAFVISTRPRRCHRLTAEIDAVLYALPLREALSPI